MKVLGVVATFVFLSLTPAFAADQTIPLATMTCKQFADSPKDTINTIVNKIMKYNQDSDEPAEINFAKMEELRKKLDTYCAQNPTHGIMAALDNVSDASDGADALKTIVGLWTFLDKPGLDRRPGGRFGYPMPDRSERHGLFLKRNVPRPRHARLGEALGRRQSRT